MDDLLIRLLVGGLVLGALACLAGAWWLWEDWRDGA